MKKTMLFLLLCLTVPVIFAQNDKKLEVQIRAMGNEKDPEVNIATMNRLISDNHLDTVKDAEMIDIIKSHVAMSYLNQGKYPQFEKYIYGMKNKFNQTSYLSMAAVTLIIENKDLPQAEKYAKATLDLYNSFKDDPAAKPAGYTKEDWSRFMGFAVYPYNDTYAMALHANGKDKLALEYQQKAFMGSPAEGIPSSVERYARLLALNGRQDEAFRLLDTMARTGKSTAAMNTQLKAIYIKQHGVAAFESYFDGLQKNVQKELEKGLRKQMLSGNTPDFTLKDIEGKTVSLSALRGRIVVLDFWATWCMPCIASFPAMKKLVEKHPEIVFLFIATEEQQDDRLTRVKAFMARNRYPFHVLMDEPVAGNADMKQFKVVSLFKPNGIPAKVVIDADGVQRFMTTGFSSDTELLNEMEAMIAVVKEKQEGK